MRTNARPFVDCQRDLQQYRDDHPDAFPKPEEPETEVRRGEQRLMAEAMLFGGPDLPLHVAHRAMTTIVKLARE